MMKLCASHWLVVWRVQFAIAFFASISIASADPAGCDPRKRLPSPKDIDFTTSGTAEPCDGDDLIIRGRDYRLNGIDAFETGQRCGGLKCANHAKNSLDNIVRGKTVHCLDIGERHGDRVIARCTVRGGSRRVQSVEELMVWLGWAFVRPDFLRNDPARKALLCRLEREAARASRGQWALKWMANDLPYFHKRGKRERLDQVTCRHEFRRGFR
jgi:endonuclease YncB( thermonuclease family)